MSRPIPEVERRQREFPCERCGAAAGQPCYTPRGETRAASHASRFNQATAAGRLPIRDEAPW